MPTILAKLLFADSSDSEAYNPGVIVNGLVGIGICSDNVWKLDYTRNEV